MQCILKGECQANPNFLYHSAAFWAHYGAADRRKLKIVIARPLKNTGRNACATRDRAKCFES